MTACELLIKANANINAETNGGVTPLQRAAMMGNLSHIFFIASNNFCFPVGHTDIVKLLLSHDADIKIQDSDGNTAAHRAAQNGHANIVHLLLSSDKSVENCINNRGHTPLNIDSNQM